MICTTTITHPLKTLCGVRSKTEMAKQWHLAIFKSTPASGLLGSKAAITINWNAVYVQMSGSS